MTPVVASMSQIGNKIFTVRALHSKRFSIRVGHYVISLKGFISIISRYCCSNAELFPLNLKCFKIGFIQEAKVTTSGTLIVFEVVIRRIVPLAAWAEHVGESKPTWEVKIYQVFLLTLHPSPTKATGQFSNKSSIFLSSQSICSYVVHLKINGGDGGFLVETI